MNLRERFESKFIPEPNSGCFLWLGFLDRDGYGTFWINGKNRKAHRVYYEMECGPIPSGFVIDHLCRNPSCVNPAHMEPVTGYDNTWMRAKRKLKQFCIRGHEYTPENVWYDKYGSRFCRTCRRIRRREWWRRHHAFH
jgi:hypothetical protein